MTSDQWTKIPSVKIKRLSEAIWAPENLDFWGEEEVLRP